MAKIANVSPSTSFNSWATTTNTIADRLSQFAINNSSLYANTITANNSLRALKNLTVSGNTTITGLLANGSLGTSNYVLKTNGATVFWGQSSGGGVIGTYTVATLGSLGYSANVVTSVTSTASQYLQVANATTLLSTKVSTGKSIAMAIVFGG